MFAFCIIMGVVVVALNIIFSLFYGDDERGMRVLGNCLTLVLVAILTATYITNYGVFGRPQSLDSKTYYHILSVTPIGEKSTVVILRDATGNTFPIQFPAQTKADTNGIYTVVGDRLDGFSLAPIK